VPVCLSPYQLLNHLVEFYEVQTGVHVTEGDIKAIIFNPVPSTIPKVVDIQIFEVDANLVPVTVGPRNFVC
jgi:hypothetical protein